MTAPKPKARTILRIDFPGQHYPMIREIKALLAAAAAAGYPDETLVFTSKDRLSIPAEAE